MMQEGACESAITQGTIEVPRVQYIDRIVNVSVKMKRRAR